MGGERGEVVLRCQLYAHRSPASCGPLKQVCREPRSASRLLICNSVWHRRRSCTTALSSALVKRGSPICSTLPWEKDDEGKKKKKKRFAKRWWHVYAQREREDRKSLAVFHSGEREREICTTGKLTPLLIASAENTWRNRVSSSLVVKLSRPDE